MTPAAAVVVATGTMAATPVAVSVMSYGDSSLSLLAIWSTEVFTPRVGTLTCTLKVMLLSAGMVESGNAETVKSD